MALSACQVRARAHFALQELMSISTSCGVGSYARSPLYPCVNCPVGTYSNSSAAASARTCRTCEKGFYSSTTGATSCSKCVQGTTSHSKGLADPQAAYHAQEAPIVAPQELHLIAPTACAQQAHSHRPHSPRAICAIPAVGRPQTDY